MIIFQVWRMDVGGTIVIGNMDTESGPGVMTLLTRLAKVVHRSSPESLLGMPFRHFQTLGLLRHHGPSAQQELSTALLMDANNLVLLLNELEAGGLVERRRDPSDRRRHIVELTTAGAAALERAERAQESTEDVVLAALSREERKALRDLLNRALEGATRATQEA
jgi:MarR family transcriptional regulator, temperature-dependent positive regulator of motility